MDELVSYAKSVILLIDEYDVPLSKAEETKNKEFFPQIEHAYTDEVKDLLKGRATDGKTINMCS